MWHLAETTTDDWTSPRTDKAFHDVAIPGNAPGLNPRGDIPGKHLRRPCHCDVGLDCPHEWSGICENGQRPTMQYEANGTTNWVYLDGKVGFGQNHWDVARELCTELGYDETQQDYISNLIARNSLPEEYDIAVGILRGGKPKMYMSTVDRNVVYDSIIRALGDAQGRDNLDI